ncbi:hypothetical protein D1AOALGA4SA_4965 [Olavius algarvensis Delta 1 endosymbiont]|nr:hypothetical protein D1AOALGA4SA_4965 [Olavius algarvensis Delta 1 endosymbiont]
MRHEGFRGSTRWNPAILEAAEIRDIQLFIHFYPINGNCQPVIGYNWIFLWIFEGIW